jgi:hypothetical protein
MKKQAFLVQGKSRLIFDRIDDSAQQIGVCDRSSERLRQLRYGEGK